MSLKGRPRLVVLDRDGVINEDSGGYVTGPEEWRPVAGSLEAIAALHGGGFEIVVATNQAGIGHGLYSRADLAAIHARMTEAVEAAGGQLAGVYYCPHRPDEGCACRKPRPGLLRRIERELGRSLEGVPLVGDKRSDLEAARSVGARPLLVLTGHGAATAAGLAEGECEVFADLAGAAHALLGETRAD